MDTFSMLLDWKTVRSLFGEQLSQPKMNMNNNVFNKILNNIHDN